jgi:hypothetical protein
MRGEGQAQRLKTDGRFVCLLQYLSSAGEDKTVRMWKVADWQESDVVTPSLMRSRASCTRQRCDSLLCCRGLSLTAVLCLMRSRDPELALHLPRHWGRTPFSCRCTRVLHALAGVGRGH